MKKYSVEWKKAQQDQNGGWAQRHGTTWRWHYIENDTEYRMGHELRKEILEIMYSKAVPRD